MSQIEKTLDALSEKQIIHLAWIFAVSLPDAIKQDILRNHTVLEIQQALKLMEITDP